MPNLASAIKRVRQIKRRTAENLLWRKKIRTLAKEVRQPNREKAAPALLSEAQEALDKAAKKRVIHPNKAARLKSRFARKLAGG